MDASTCVTARQHDAHFLTSGARNFLAVYHSRALQQVSDISDAEISGLARSHILRTLSDKKDMGGACYVRRVSFQEPATAISQWWPMAYETTSGNQHSSKGPRVSTRRIAGGEGPHTAGAARGRPRSGITSRRPMIRRPSRRNPEGSRGSPSARCSPTGGKRPRTGGSPPGEPRAECSRNEAEALPRRRCSSCGRQGM